MECIIRILTIGKNLTVIDQAILDAIQSGNRVFVKASTLAVNSPENGSPTKLDSENSIIAK